MATRDIKITPRAENTREARPIITPIQFSLSEIKKHFTDSLMEVRNQFAVADDLEANDNYVACKMVWRSQVILAESLLDFYIHEISKYCLVRMLSGEWEKNREV